MRGENQFRTRRVNTLVALVGLALLSCAFIVFAITSNVGSEKPTLEKRIPNELVKVKSGEVLDVWKFNEKDINGVDVDLRKYSGMVAVVLNVASK